MKITVHKSMEEAFFQDLKIRCLMSHVYVHLRNCEHLITFVDARLKTSDDPTCKYPLIQQLEMKAQDCLACELFDSEWIVEDNRSSFSTYVPQSVEPFYFVSRQS